MKNPAMLTQRGKLLEMARVQVDESGYQYKKKRSRSKYFGGASEPTVKRPKFSKELRMERINEIQEELKTIDKRIDMLLNQKVGERKFVECDKISESVDELKGRRRTLSAELHTFEKKERQAQWYESKKSSTCQSSSCSPSPSSLASVSPPVFSPVCGRSLFRSHGRLRRALVSPPERQCSQLHSPSLTLQPSHIHSSYVRARGRLNSDLAVYGSSHSSPYRYSGHVCGPFNPPWCSLHHSTDQSSTSRMHGRGCLSLSPERPDTIRTRGQGRLSLSPRRMGTQVTVRILLHYMLPHNCMVVTLLTHFPAVGVRIPLEAITQGIL